VVNVAQVSPEQIPELRAMLSEYLEWAFQLDQGSTQAAPTFQNIEEELADLPGIFVPPRGRLLVADVDGRVQGSIALKEVDREVGEVKRFFVRPDCRGQGVGGQLVRRMLEEAHSIGYKKLILDSHASMVDAHNVYRKAGFVNCRPFEGFPQWLVPQVVFMEMKIGSNAEG
jgi:putative acetyltransferase